MKRILIIEDEPDIQELLDAYLRDAGYETATAGDGVEALARFDLMLPKIDGFGVCEWIRRESAVPILMLTALDGEEEQLRGFELEIDDYVTKPFSMPVDKALFHAGSAAEDPGHSAADRQRTGGGRKPALSGADSGGGRDGGLPGRQAAGSDRAGV